MSNGAHVLETLRGHRPLLLGCEAIGWLHMTGKAHPDFLRHHGGAGVSYDDSAWLNRVSPPFPWCDKLRWLKDQDTAWHKLLDTHWPSALSDFIRKHRGGNGGILGLLQAGHALASGIEKNVPGATSEYLKQDVTHMWLASPFGHPVRNLLADPPAVLKPGAFERLLDLIGKLLEDLRQLVETAEVDPWWQWRQEAIGPAGWLREAFLSTLAETRLPNNDVTLWDQSYVAAALFKSAVAGALLANCSQWQDLKWKTRWRVLTVGFGSRHYEARAVRIGDWVGARRDIDKFFEEVGRLIEVDLAVGSLVYRDDETQAFTFPGLRLDANDQDSKGSLDDRSAEALRGAIETEVDELASRYKFETPPVVRLSESTRSFIGMVAELGKARDELAVPVHRNWRIQEAGQGTGHVCPVCQVRFNQPGEEDRTENARKQRVCGVCAERRKGRLDAWLEGESDTIWISEVADENDRVVLLTFSLDIEAWIGGESVDSLRAQSISEWRRFNPELGNEDNPVDRAQPSLSLISHVLKKLRNYDKNDPVLRSLHDGYRQESRWEDFFAKIVEDRSDAPKWERLDDEARARWIVHQLFRKLPSPGRVYRFWRTAEGFFDELLEKFRELASASPNRWRTQRLALKGDEAKSSQGWKDRETYLGRWREAPLEVLYVADRKEFLTICNLARCLAAENRGDLLREEKLKLKGDDDQVKELVIHSVRTPENLGMYAPVIALERSPQRFRVLVPLDRATSCIEAAIAKWRDEFARVWDRMPLRIGVVAFPRLTPFQAVIEAARNLEDALRREGTETWRVLECRTREGVTALSVEHDRGRELILIPTRLGDGREDVFYPYVQVEDQRLRSGRDFQHPDGRVYRHMADLKPGDGVLVHPSRLAAVFLDTAGRRFELPKDRPLGDFGRMQAVWDLLLRQAPSLTALRSAWAEIEERSRGWRDAEGRWLAGAEVQWLDLTRAILRARLNVSGAALETLVDAARDGVLEWALEWHLTWLKEPLEEQK
jgi:CRISPR-associated Csx11 family protein